MHDLAVALTPNPDQTVFFDSFAAQVATSCPSAAVVTPTMAFSNHAQI
jgi:hypothetical protein